MTKKLSDKVLNIRLGAIFNMAVINRLSRQDVERLLIGRAMFSQHDAEILAAHWFTTRALRCAA